MATFLQFFAAALVAYGLIGALYCLSLHAEAITRRYTWAIAMACVIAFWPIILWSEVEHSIKERRRLRAYSIPTKEYLTAVADLSERRGRACR